MAPHLLGWAVAVLTLLSGVAVAVLLAQGRRAREAEAHWEARARALEGSMDELQSLLLDAKEQMALMHHGAQGRADQIAEWAATLGGEIARSLGAREVGVFEAGEGRRGWIRLAGAEAPEPPAELLEAFTVMRWADGLLQLPLLAWNGELVGALVLTGLRDLPGEGEARMLQAFASQVGNALELRRARERVEAAQSRRAASAREMIEQGISPVQICPHCGACYDHTVDTCPRDGRLLEWPSRPIPHRFLERYQLTQRLGHGGMGVVFAAEDQRLGRDVALKLIQPERFSDAFPRERFEQEARIAAQLAHPGIVALYDSGELADGTVFLVMERLRGADLARVLRTYGPGAPAQVAELLRQGAQALGEAHRLGIIHRDIKPGNIFLVPREGGFQAKVLDFGIAKRLHVDDQLTLTGTVFGTPQYMAPEQLQGLPVGARADVYSFACVVYEALTGRPAVQGSDLASVLMRVLHQVPPAPSRLVPGLNPYIDAALAHGMAKDPMFGAPDVVAWAEPLADALAQVPAARPGWPDAFLESLREASRTTDHLTAGSLRVTASPEPTLPIWD